MCAIWLAAVDGCSPPAKLSAITLTASLIDQAERFLPELVTSARLNGHTWQGQGCPEFARQCRTLL